MPRSRHTSSAATAHFVPAAHALHLAEWLEGYGVDRAQLVAGFGRSYADMQAIDARLSAHEVEWLIERARVLTGVRAVGLYLGLKMRVSVHGYLGFAAMTARHVREALQLAERFAPTLTNAFALQLVEHDESLAEHEAALVIREIGHFGSAHDEVVFALLWGIACIGSALTGQALRGRAEVTGARPDYFYEFEPMLNGSAVVFEQPVSRLVFARSLLDTKLTMADPAALALARAQCELALDAARGRDSLAARVRAVLQDEHGVFRSLDAVAAKLLLSTRSLKRHLAGEGQSFSTLLAEARMGQAQRLLGGSLSIEQIAARLGYSDAPNFTRAFRKHHGVTPARYRRSQQR